MVKLNSGVSYYGPVQLSVVLLSYYTLGFIYGTLFVIAFFKLFTFLLFHFWQIEIATVGDYLFKYHEDQAC
jgi:hypothetical protein